MSLALVVVQSLSRVQLLCPLQPARLLCPWNSRGKNTGVGCHSFLQGTFPMQGLNLSLLHCRHSLPSEPPWKSEKVQQRDSKADQMKRKRGSVNQKKGQWNSSSKRGKKKEKTENEWRQLKTRMGHYQTEQHTPVGIPKGEEREKEAESFSENLGKETDIRIQESPKAPKEMNLKRFILRSETYYNCQKLKTRRES